MAYKISGTSSLYNVWGDFIVYRNLVPADKRLPSLAQLRPRLGLAEKTLPRKADPEYGLVIAEILGYARALDRPGTKLKRLIYIGDTLMNDSTAFRNLCAAGEWPGWAFIGKDDLAFPQQVHIQDTLYIANRWSALPGFIDFLSDKGFVPDAATALVIDMDKTALGARGRNDRVIDQARIESVKRTVANLLGSHFNSAAFDQAYDELNQPTYHPFTADNQDYLAYICLMLGAGLFELDVLVHQVKTGAMQHFVDLLAQVENRRAELEETGLTTVHDDVWQCVQAGDPTPFKAFRYNEYLATVARFGNSETNVERALAQRLVITQEIRQFAATVRKHGGIIFGLSDKPDEASLPNEAQAQAGMQALHRLETLTVGEEM